MSIKRAYRRSSVKSVDLPSLLSRHESYGNGPVNVGLDISKPEIVAVIRWSKEAFDRPLSVENPGEISMFVELLSGLSKRCPSLTIGMESTGTYGDAVRFALTSAQLEVHRIGNKGCSDFRELFDGVPSQHDGKDAAMIAELTSLGKGTPWPFVEASERDQEIAQLVQRLATYNQVETSWMGRMEGLLAKSWPELTRILKLTSATLLQIMLHYGGPRQLAADPECRCNLRRWGRSGLKASVIEEIVASAETTMGVPQSKSQVAWIQEVAMELRMAQEKIKSCEKRLEELIMSDDVSKQLSGVLGSTTLSVVLATVGDPKNYDSSGAFLKALGLNLKEFSSGKHRGQLKLTKRGPSVARKYLYYWALRALTNPSIRKWFDQFKKVGNSQGRNTEYRKMKGVIALMRKLCRSLWYVRTHGLTFDYSKVFPGRPLDKPRRRRRRRQLA